MMGRFVKAFFHSRQRHVCFLLSWILSLAFLRTTVGALVRLSLNDYRYSHIILIPFISAGLICWRRRRLFGAERWSPGWGMLLAGIGIALYVAVRTLYPARGDGLPLAAFALVIVWIAEFVFCYGLQTSGSALFPLLFLLMTVPAPGVLLDRVIALLQRGSAETTSILFTLIGEAVFRDGYRFSLPGITIEVAKECSSIRSGTALFITGLLAGYAFLRSPWRRVLLSVATVPIAMFTNGVRIVTLCWLSRHVNPGFLYGDLHHKGGALFSLISVMTLLALLFLLSDKHFAGLAIPLRGSLRKLLNE